MVHQYQLNGYNIVLDTCSGSIHVVDEVAYDIIALFEDHAPEEIVSAIRYINRHYSEPISLEQAAGRVHMSRYHFCRVFHSAAGATFLEYLYNVRLAKAHQLLLGSDLRLSEIASRCGFSSTSHLTRIFKNTYGMPPGEFRKKAGALSGA